MKPVIRAFTALIVGAMAMFAVLTPIAAQAATGTVNVSVRNCSQLSGPAQLPGDPGDCTAGSGVFTFYLVGDGINDYDQVAINGDGAINLMAGTYEVVEENSQVHVSVTVEANTATSLLFGFPAATPPAAPAPAEPAPPPAAPAPAAETATLNVNTYACTGVVGSPIALVDIGPDCTRIATNVDFYLWGDGTDDSWNLSTSASGPVSINLQVGGYEVVNTNSWATLGTQVPSGGATLSIGYGAVASPAPAPAPTPAPVAETATLNVNTYACTGVVGSPIALVDIGPDCTRIATNVDFYLWGDGTDDSWNLSTSASGPVSINLQVGGYEVVNTNSWATLGTQVPSGGATLSIGYAAVAAPAPVETGTVNVSVYSCTGLTNPGVLTDVGPDCTPTSGLFTFYLWGDGTDDYVQLSVDASGVGSINLPVGEYEVVEENTQVKMPVAVTADETSNLKFGFPATTP